MRATLRFWYSSTGGRLGFAKDGTVDIVVNDQTIKGYDM